LKLLDILIGKIEIKTPSTVPRYLICHLNIL